MRADKFLLEKADHFAERGICKPDLKIVDNGNSVFRVLDKSAICIFNISAFLHFLMQLPYPFF